MEQPFPQINPVFMRVFGMLWNCGTDFEFVLTREIHIFAYCFQCGHTLSYIKLAFLRSTCSTVPQSSIHAGLRYAKWNFNVEHVPRSAK